MPNVYISLAVIAVATFIGAIGSIFLKKGASQFHINIHSGIYKLIIDTLRNWQIILGVFLYFISSIFFLYLLRTEDLSLLYPMTALSYVFVTILSVSILKEKVNKYKLSGIIIIMIGVFLITI